MNNRIIPVLGHVQLAQLTPLLLQNYVNNLKEEGLGNSTIKKIYNIIKSSPDYAVNMELLPSNPAKKDPVTKG
jgi:site-specific recombinase XerC